MTDDRDPMARGGPDGDGVLAAEYVLGLLDAPTRDAVEARLAVEPALRAEVARWQEDFAGMALDLPPVEPPAGALARLETELFGASRPEVRPDARPPAGALAAARGGARRFWQGLLLGGALTGAGLAVLVLGLPGVMAPVLTLPGPAPQSVQAAPLFAAEVTGDAGLSLLAVYEAEAGTLRLARTEGAATPGRVLELWVIAGQDAPVSLGVLPADRSAVVAVPQGLRAAVAGGLLAVSDEPPGGSPTGAPTGAVLAAGPVTSL